MNLIKKNLLNLILIFFLGGIGGVFFSDILLPKLLSYNVFSDLAVAIGERITIVNKTENISIYESEILDNLIKKNRESLVVIKNFRDDKFISSGAGFIVSSDGLILTRREVVSDQNNDISIERDGNKFSAKIHKRLDDNGLILLKSNASNLPVVSFASPSDILLGNKVILIGNKINSLGNYEFVDVGFLRSIDDFILETSIQDDTNLLSGTPLLDLKGNVLGINFTNSKGDVLSVPSEVIKSFIY
ncbi:MAG: trypsin-like peptidase domain-containing protein [Patescibacteria group bacterium]